MVSRARRAGRNEREGARPAHPGTGDTAHTAHTVTNAVGDLRGRRNANSYDRYSLFLQLIQVFPVLSAVLLAVVANSWLAFALSGSVLLSATAGVVYVDRLGGRDSREEGFRDRQAVEPPAPAAPVAPASAPQRVRAVPVSILVSLESDPAGQHADAAQHFVVHVAIPEQNGVAAD